MKVYYCVHKTFLRKRRYFCILLFPLKYLTGGNIFTLWVKESKRSLLCMNCHKKADSLQTELKVLNYYMSEECMPPINIWMRIYLHCAIVHIHICVCYTVIFILSNTESCFLMWDAAIVVIKYVTLLWQFKAENEEID